MELAPLSEGAQVPHAVARALDVHEQPGRPIVQTLVENLRSRRMLLILDNCEHLIDASARLVDRLLGSCEHLRVLATSRETLGVAGEVNWPVPSLTVPDQASALQGLMQYEAVQLFVERARSRLPTFALTPENAGSVVSVCRKLDGIPLAIELATARMAALAVEQIVERLDDSLGLLTTGNRTAAPRQQTLKATLEWSYDLLDEHERRLFARLSVFAGGWTLEAAEAVGAGDPVPAGRVLDLLSKLVDKSLVVVDASPSGASRYRMLEPVRQYALELFVEGGEEEMVRRAHAEYFLALAEEAEPELLGPDQGRWLVRLRTESENLRGALSWSLEPDQEDGWAQELRLRLVAALCRFWDVEGFQESRRWLQAALERDSEGSAAVRAKALGGLGWILVVQRDFGPAIAALEEAVALYKDLGDETDTAFALANLGHSVLHGGYYERVPAFIEEGEALMEKGLDGLPGAHLRIILASAAMEQGDLDSATSQLEESLALCREAGDRRGASISLFVLGAIELQQGHLEGSTLLLEESARITRELGDTPGIAYCVWTFGKLSATRGQPVRAARLWGAAEALREQMGLTLSHFDLAQSGYERDLAAVRSALPEASFEAAWNEGRNMDLEQAIEYALSEDEPEPSIVSEPEEPSSPPQPPRT